MRILQGSRELDEIELHLTDAEAERLVDLVSDCRHDLAEVGLSQSHWHLIDGSREVTVFLYAKNDELESEVEARLGEEATD